MCARWKMVAMAGASVVLLSACGSSGSSSSSASSTTKPAASTKSKISLSSLKFDYANVTDNSTLFNAIQSGYIAATAKIGAHLTTYNNNLSGTTALTNARLMVNDHPNLIFEYNVVAGLGHSLGTTFQRANTPCIAVNVPASPCAWENLNNPKLGEDTATVMAQYMKQKGWTGANTTVIIAQNATAGTDVNSSVRDFYSKLAQLIPNMKQIPGTSISATTTTIGTTGIQVNTGGTLNGAFKAVQNVLQSLPASRHIVLYANNDDETLGGWQAVVQAGRSKDALVAGLGGSAPAMKQLRTNPQWVGEGQLFTQGWGEVGVAMAVAMLEGAHPPAVTYIPQIVLTKSNVNKYMGSSNTTAKLMPALPSGDAYLLKTGVLQKFHNIEGLG